jgi:hypothetical protein
VKKQVHEEMELKDQELRDIRQQCVNLQEESKICTEKVDKLEKSSQFIMQQMSITQNNNRNFNKLQVFHCD